MLIPTGPEAQNCISIRRKFEEKEIRSNVNMADNAGRHDRWVKYIGKAHTMGLITQREHDLCKQEFLTGKKPLNSKHKISH